MNVLLLEPDRRTRTTLEVVLAQRGHHVDVCGDASDLLTAARRATYQLIVLGIEQPDGRARELLKELGRRNQRAAPIIIGVVPNEDLATLPSDIMEMINQVLVRPLNVELLREQFDAFEQQAIASERSRYALSMPNVSREALLVLADRGFDIGMVLDAEGRIRFTTSGIEQITGHNRQALLGRSLLSVIHPGDRPRINQFFSGDEEEARLDIRILGDGEAATWFDLRLVNLMMHPEVRGFAVAGWDASVRHDLQQRLEETRALVQHGIDYVAVIDELTVVKYQTPAFEQLLGACPENKDAPFLERIHENDRPRAQHSLAELQKTPGGARRFEVRMKSADDIWRTLDVTCTNLLHVHGVNGIVVNAHDITDRKTLEHRLARRAFLDPLTDLPNRTYFLHRLERALSRSNGSQTQIAVLFLDLDRFKLINDSLGHEIGDQLLVAVAQRLKQIVRPGDMVARFGGDELIILLDDITGLDEATAVASRIISEIGSPLQLERHEVSISTSVGIALNEPPTTDANDLIRNADIALYRAKESGASRYVVFDESMARRVIARLELENDLRQGFERDEFRIEFLPELNLENGKLSGLEVLTRWKHPARGDIDPDEFMPVADETGLIVQLGRWAFTQACAHVRGWQMRHPTARQLTIAINLSAREFQQPDLVEFIISTLGRYGIAAHMVRIEIDESTMAAGPEEALGKLRALRDYGICLAIDNFGSGFSSLSYLTQLSFDMLKVDRQFISGDGGAVSNLSIVRAVTSLAHALGMIVTAEGIETREHLARVRAAGCDCGQGYLFSRSLDAAAVEAIFLSSNGA